VLVWSEQRGGGVPQIWARLLGTKETKNQWAVIMSEMERLADDKRMDFDAGVYFSDKTIDSLMKLEPNPGDAKCCHSDKRAEHSGEQAKDHS
jgi:hypothetical protein